MTTYGLSSPTPHKNKKNSQKNLTGIIHPTIFINPLPRFFFRRTRYRCQDVVISPLFVSSSSLDDNIRSFTSSLKLWKKRWQWLDDDRYDDPVPLDPLLAVLLASSQWSSDCNPWRWSSLKLAIPSGCWTTITGRCLSYWRKQKYFNFHC